MKNGPNFNELTPELQQHIRRETGYRKPREQGLNADKLRGWAYQVPATLAKLSTTDRERVLKHAIRLNRIAVRESKRA
jgi:hypothetical protein